MLEVVSAGGNLAVMPATTFNRMISGVVSLTKLCHDKPWLYALSFDWVSLALRELDEDQKGAGMAALPCSLRAGAESMAWLLGIPMRPVDALHNHSKMFPQHRTRRMPPPDSTRDWPE